MIEVRQLETLGGADHSWLQVKRHFAFTKYNDPVRMGCGLLRVWNNDIIAPGAGFPNHLHREMEIIT